MAAGYGGIGDIRFGNKIRLSLYSKHMKHMKASKDRLSEALYKNCQKPYTKLKGYSVNRLQTRMRVLRIKEVLWHLKTHDADIGTELVSAAVDL